MKRIHFFEIEDQSWCPKSIRDGVTDFLQHIVCVFHLYGSITPRLCQAIIRSKQPNIVDLCSGGAGQWLSLIGELQKQLPDLKIILTDLYPNKSAFRRIQSCNPEHISYWDTPVDATQVPNELTGFRTLFSSFHHLTPTQAQDILQSAVNRRSGIAIFESTQRHPLLLLYMLITPLLVIINTPFIHPFRWNRLFWTYLIPAIPVIVMIDGIISCLRTYTVEELKALTEKLSSPNYHWEIGLERIGRLPIGVTYIIGTPLHSLLK